jgi:hypothetical protein
MCHVLCLGCRVLTLAGVFFALAINVSADEPSSWLQPPTPACAVACQEKQELIVKFSPYGWLTRMNGDVSVGRVTAPLDITFGKMWDLDFHDLDFAFLGQLEAYYGRLGILANGAYFALNPDTSIRQFDFGSRVSQTALDVDFTYTLFGTPETKCGCISPRFDLIAGIRYYSLTGDVTVTGPFDNSASRSGAVAWTDLVLGGRFVIPVNASWSFSARGDYGGFGINGCSQAAWNVELLGQYQWSDRVSLFAGYRWLSVDFSQGSGSDYFRYNVQTDGPLVGVTFRF